MRGRRAGHAAEQVRRPAGGWVSGRRMALALVCTVGAAAIAATLTVYLGRWILPTPPAAVSVLPAPDAGNAQPPPAPALFLAAGSDTGVPGDGVTADRHPQISVAAAEDREGYQVLLYLDGSGSPLAMRTVPAAGGIGSAVQLPDLEPGRHEIRAVARGGAGRAEAPPLALTVVTGPVQGSRVFLDGNGDGVAGEGDSVTVEFDRSLLPESVCSDWGADPAEGDVLRDAVVTLAPDRADGAATLTIAPPPRACGFAVSALAFGRITLNGGYLRTSEPVRFTGSDLRLAAGGRAVAVTLGTPELGAGAGLGRVPVPSQPVFTPTGQAPTDVAGNPVEQVGFADASRSGF